MGNEEIANELKIINKKLMRIEGVMSRIKKDLEEIEMEARFMQVELGVDDAFRRWGGNV